MLFGGRNGTRATSTRSAASRSTAAPRPTIHHVRLASLPHREAHRLFDEMGQVMVRTVVASDPGGDSWAAPDWERRRADMVAGADVYQVTAGGQTVGFLAYQVVELLGRPCVHLLAAYILPEFQGRGLGFTLNARLVFRMLARRPGRAYYLAATILNPIALCGWRARITRPVDFYPLVADEHDTRASAAPSESLVSAARTFAAEQYPGLVFDPASGLLRAKTLPRGAAASASGDAATDRLFERVVDQGRGDTILMVVDGSRRMLAAEIGEMLTALPRALRSASGSRREHRDD